MTYNKFDTKRLNDIPIKELFRVFGIELKRNKALCVFHNDKTPSLSIRPSTNRFRCFGCGESGSVIDFVVKYKKIPFIDACLFLVKEFCMEQNKYSSINRKRRQTINSRYIRKESSHNNSYNDIKNKKPDPEIYEWFFNNLIVTEGLIKFIKSRKYPLNVIDEYNLKGFNYSDQLLNICIERWGTDKLINCGLLKMVVDEMTGEIAYRLNWWTESLLIPFYDLDGNIIYIQGRTLNQKSAKKFKYVNLSGIQTPIFNLTQLSNLTPNDNLIITEGVTDCISCKLMGKNAIGIIGSNGYKSEYNVLLDKYKITIIPDNDISGLRFAEMIKKGFQAIGKNINIYMLDKKYKDITEYYIAEWKK